MATWTQQMCDEGKVECPQQQERGMVTQAGPHSFSSLGPTTQCIQHSQLWSLQAQHLQQTKSC